MSPIPSFAANNITPKHHLALLQSFGTTFCEAILPAGKPLHVFGKLQSLRNEEFEELQKYAKYLDIEKSPMHLTVGGDEFHIGLKDENSLLKSLKKNTTLNSKHI